MAPRRFRSRSSGRLRLEPARFASLLVAVALTFMSGSVAWAQTVRPAETEPSSETDSPPATDATSATDAPSDDGSAAQPAEADPESSPHGSPATVDETESPRAGGDDLQSSDDPTAEPRTEDAPSTGLGSPDDTAVENEVPSSSPSDSPGLSDDAAAPPPVLDGGYDDDGDVSTGRSSPQAVEPDDAGPPPVTGAAGASTTGVGGTRGPWGDLVEELLFERRRRESERVDLHEEPSTNPVSETSPRTLDVRVVGCDADREVLGLGFPERRISTPGLVLMLVLAVLALAFLERVRHPLPRRGLLPRLLGGLLFTGRLAALAMVIMLASRVLPGWLRPALLLTIAAVAVAVGVGAVWTVLPDVVSGVILVTERRLRPGAWIVAGSISGRVEQIGPRLTTLKQYDGATMTVPNRFLVRERVRIASERWYEVDLVLTVPFEREAAAIRQAIRDAVACSPYVPPQPRAGVSRDPTHPMRWRVRARLVDPAYEAEFEGQLLERVEENLNVGRSSGGMSSAEEPDGGAEAML